MLHPDLLRNLLRSQPFRPFRMVMNSGQNYDIHHPEFVTVGRSWVTIHESDHPESGIADRFHLVSLMLMEHTEFLDNATPRRRRGR
jgi:hypothetical protein